MHDRDDPRAEELNNLRLALATFALQLDAFEARIKGRLTKPNGETALARYSETHNETYRENPPRLSDSSG
jgi:hypothetical protein